ncbi:MAG: hypothetical protein D4R68_01120 [Ignavibacteriales bacterium]|nr:MAG: hypothetical protein D4R68_01120 [Ignavibacteriales bacterium]
MKKSHLSFIILGYFIISLVCSVAILVLKVKIEKKNYLLDRKNILISETLKKKNTWESHSFTNMKLIGYKFSNVEMYDFDGKILDKDTLFESRENGLIIFLINLEDANGKEYFEYLHNNYKNNWNNIPIKYVFLFDVHKRHKYTAQNLTGSNEIILLDNKGLIENIYKFSFLLYLNSSLKVQLSYGVSSESFKDLNCFFKALGKQLE